MSFKKLLPTQVNLKSKYGHTKAPMRPAIIMTTRQDKQQNQLTTKNVIYVIQNSISILLKKNLTN